MSNLSIQNSPNFSPIYSERFPLDSCYTNELQSACEERNSTAILDLVQRGANPSEAITYTPPIAKMLIEGFVKEMIDYEAFSQFLLELTFENVKEISLEPRDEVLLVNAIRALEKGEKVEESELLQVAVNLTVHQAFTTLEDIDDIKVFPLLIVLASADFDAARSLVSAGANFKDPEFLETLEALALHNQYEQILNFLKDLGLSQDELRHMTDARFGFINETVGDDESLDMDLDIDWEKVFEGMDCSPSDNVLLSQIPVSLSPKKSAIADQASSVQEPIEVNQEKVSADFLAKEMQRAFESGDIQKVGELIDQGANPNQEIQLTKEVVSYFVSRQTDRFVRLFYSISFDQPVDNQLHIDIDNEYLEEEFANAVTSWPIEDQMLYETISRRTFENNGCLAKDLSTLQTKAYLNQLFQEFGQEISQVSILPLMLALTEKDLTVAHKLVQAGAFINLDELLDQFALRIEDIDDLMFNIHMCYDDNEEAIKNFCMHYGIDIDMFE